MGPGVRVPPPRPIMVGIAQLVRAPDCGSGGREFDSHYPPHFDPLAQSVEHLTFNQGVPRSSRGWITKYGEVSEWFKELVLKTSDA